MEQNVKYLLHLFSSLKVQIREATVPQLRFSCTLYPVSLIGQGHAQVELHEYHQKLSLLALALPLTPPPLPHLLSSSTFRSL